MLAALLGSARLFERVGNEERLALANASTLRRYERRAVIWRRGEEADALGFVVAGRLDVVRWTVRGDRLFLRAYHPGDIVGLSTIGGCPHTADIVAGDSTEVLMIPHHVLVRDASILRAALGLMGDLLGRLSDEVEEQRSLIVEDRLRRRLEREVRRKRREVTFTHQDLADQIHASREEVSRSLKKFERLGAIRCKRGRIEIVALGKLELPSGEPSGELQLHR